MKTAGVVIDDWKLPIFKRHLDGAGSKYTEFLGENDERKKLHWMQVSLHRRIRV